jgi:hypothetical protein
MSLVKVWTRFNDLGKSLVEIECPWTRYNVLGKSLDAI